jgi:hypothetical protein
MNSLTSSIKQKKIFRVRRRLKPAAFNCKTKSRVYKIAKKVTGDNLKNFMCDRGLEDFLLKSSSEPHLFFESSPLITSFEVLSPALVIQQKNESGANKVSGCVNRYLKSKNALYPAVNLSNSHSNFETLNANFSSSDYKQKKDTSEKPTQPENFREKNDQKIISPDELMSLLNQAKSIKAYEKQKKYWKKIETTISDIVKKPPERLALNSTKLYEAKKQKIETIDQLKKFNQKSGKFIWKESLRGSLYTSPEPPISPSPFIFESVNSKSKNIKGILRNSTFFANKKKLRLNFPEYSQHGAGSPLESNNTFIKGHDRLSIKYKSIPKVQLSGQNFMQPQTEKII